MELHNFKFVGISLKPVFAIILHLPGMPFRASTTLLHYLNVTEMIKVPHSLRHLPEMLFSILPSYVQS